MKKLLILVLSLVFVLGLTSCNNAKTETITSEQAELALTNAVEAMTKNEDGTEKTAEQLAETYKGIKGGASLTASLDLTALKLDVTLNSEFGLSTSILASQEDKDLSNCYAKASYSVKTAGTSTTTSTSEASAYLKDGNLYTALGDEKVYSYVGDFIKDFKKYIEDQSVERVPGGEYTEIDTDYLLAVLNGMLAQSGITVELTAEQLTELAETIKTKAKDAITYTVTSKGANQTYTATVDVSACAGVIIDEVCKALNISLISNSALYLTLKSLTFTGTLSASVTLTKGVITAAAADVDVKVTKTVGEETINVATVKANAHVEFAEVKVTYPDFTGYTLVSNEQ